MTRGARIYFAGCAALIAYALCYALPIYARLPRPFYDPIGHRWLFTAAAGPIPMGYVGQILYGAIAALAAAALTQLVCRRVRSQPSSETFGLFAAWTLTVVGIVGGYFTWNNWP
jgi:hypothetical protein